MKASGHMTSCDEGQCGHMTSCDEGQWSHDCDEGQCGHMSWSHELLTWAVVSMSEEHLGSPQGTSGSHSLEGSQAGSTTPDPCLPTEAVWAETDSVVGSTSAA